MKHLIQTVATIMRIVYFHMLQISLTGYVFICIDMISYRKYSQIKLIIYQLWPQWIVK